MKINWKVRVKSGAFWAGVLSAVAVAVFAVLDLCGIQTGVTVDKIISVGMLILSALAAIGAISDPTTKGLSDSQQALTYTIPKSDNPQVVAAIDGTATDNSVTSNSTYKQIYSDNDKESK